MRHSTTFSDPAAGGPHLPFPDLSVIVPVKDEAGNIRPQIDEIHRALDDKFNIEIIYVNDGSTDGTLAELGEIARQDHRLRVLSHQRCAGQSAALRTAFKAARGALVVTLDGDLQNDPANIPLMVRAFRAVGGERASDADPASLGMVIGRRARRQDSWAKRWASRGANRLRGALLRDGVSDSGCALKVMPTAVARELPYFDHFHRFLAALVIREGLRVIEMPVNHRARTVGASKYGVWNRLWVGIYDMFGVVWLMRRRRFPGEVSDITPPQE